MNYEIHVDGYIGPDDFFSLMGGSETFSLKKLNEVISAMPADAKEIDVFINSGGGLVSEGFAIHDRLKSLPQKVNTIVLGLCGSIATVVAQANANGGVRKMYENSEYFIHNPIWTPQGPDPLEASDLEKLKVELQAAQERILDFYHKVTGTKKSSLKAKMDEQTTMSPTDAKAMGFVDEVIETVLTNQKKYAIAAYINFKNSNNMADLKKLFGDFENKMLASVKAIVKGNTTPTKVTSDEGTVIFYTGDLKMDTKCFSDEAMTTPTVDGEYTIAGDVYTVAGGVVTEVETKAAESTEPEAVKELKAELEATKLTNTKLTNDLKLANEKVTEVENTTKAALEEMQTGFTNFKKNFFTGDKLKPEFEQSFRGGAEGADKDPVQALKDYRAKKAEAAKK